MIALARPETLEGLGLVAWFVCVVATAVCLGLAAGLALAMLDRRRRGLPVHQGPVLFGILVGLAGACALGAVWIGSGS
jgi:hypothetical protein